MKPYKFYFSILVFIIFLTAQLRLNAQLNFTVNSLADDEHCFAWDDPDTPDIDESIDGICEDENHNCSLRAAIEEAFNLESAVDIDFSVSGTINLSYGISLPDGSTMNGSGQIELKNLYTCLGVENNCTVNGLKISGALSGVGLAVGGTNNKIGGLTGGNEIVGNLIGMVVSGDSNEVIGNYIGIDKSDNLMGNGWGMMIAGNRNQIGKNTLLYSNKICGNNVVGIQLEVGGFNNIQANYIGTTPNGQMGLGNQQGILLTVSSYNTIGGDDPLLGNVISGNTEHGIYITGATQQELSFNNEIANNIIGLSPLQDAAVPNGNGIVLSDGSQYSLIHSNNIAGNTQSGIYIFALFDTLATIDNKIYNNYIGINDNSDIFPNGNGILIKGFANSITIGSEINLDYGPNYIIGNQGMGGIVVDQTNSPKQIWIRKNDIYQNTPSNLMVSPNANLGIQPPDNLSVNGITLSGTHQIANAVIDIYEANQLESPPSAYQWLGSTTTGSNGVFSFDITDPNVKAVSVTASTTAAGTSSFAYFQIITDVENEGIKPTEFFLYQNFPNPFNPSTSIQYAIGSRQYVTLKVYDILGNEVVTLVSEEKAGGTYKVDWNASNLPSGVYFYKLHSGGFLQTRKMILLK